MNHKLTNNYYDNIISAVIQTDLSAAFDTVDHDILINKLEHYGLRGKISRIIKSFLSDRHQYVSIDGVNSTIKKALPCSVIQGSKLSSLLYKLYINEVVVLQQLMNDEIYTKLTNDYTVYNNDTIKHEIIQYVDDSNNIISTDKV